MIAEKPGAQRRRVLISKKYIIQTMSERSFLMEHYTLPHRHNQSMSQLMSHLPNIEEFQTTADIFKQLSVLTRIRIFWIFCHRAKNVLSTSLL